MKLPAYLDGDTRTRRKFAFVPVKLYNARRVKVWLEFVWVKEKYDEERNKWYSLAYWQGDKEKDGPLTLI